MKTVSAQTAANALVTAAAAEEITPAKTPVPLEKNSKPESSAVIVGAGVPVTMPGFVGQPMRNVVAAAANLGLNVRVYGDGIATDQAPAAGTRIPAGTTVVVRFHP